MVRENCGALPLFRCSEVWVSPEPLQNGRYLFMEKQKETHRGSNAKRLKMVPTGRFPGQLLILILVMWFLLTGTGFSEQVSRGLKVSSIRIEGNRLLSAEQILNRFRTRPGGLFYPEVFENDIEELLCFYENNGYPFCQIRPYDFQLEAGQLSLTLKIEEGPLVVVDSIRVVGNEITRRDVLLRELGLRLPLVYCQRRIDQAWARVRRLGFFSEVYPPEIYYDKDQGTGVLVLRVKEGRVNVVNGVLGYEPKGSKIGGRLKGMMEFSFKNILGTGRKAEARWSRRGSFSELCLEYEEPWILGLPVNLGGSFAQRQETGYSQVEFAISARMPVGTRVCAQITSGWKRVIPDSVGSFSMPRSNSLTAGLSLEYDTRDYPFNPTQGLLWRSKARFGYRRNCSTDHFTPERRKTYNTWYQLGLEHYRAVLSGQILAMRTQVAWIGGTERFIPISEKLPLGGTRSLRGYRERQFLGFRTGWFSLEYRLLLGKYSRVFVFLDAGAYSDRTPQQGNFTVGKIGYGVGIRAESRVGIVGIDYGLGEGDGILDGKVHLQITSQF